MVEGLQRAAVAPAGLPLHGRPPCLFPSSAAAKKAALACKAEGYLRVHRSEGRGRQVREICTITEKGLAYLLRQVSPKQVLTDLVHALHAQQSQVGELLASVRQWQANIDDFKLLVNKALHESHETAGSRNGKLEGANTIDSAGSFVESSRLRQAILSDLTAWQESGAVGDCPLPRVYQSANRDGFTLGQFHDELRRLQEQERIYLHPWTGPLSEIPEPACALLAGHGIAYYASLRNGGADVCSHDR
jgi:DNA-binding PadR family transcriptional regulator